MAVTGGQYLVNDTVIGAKSGAQGTVVAWDSVNLTLTGVVGVFQINEAVSNGSTTVGTVQNFENVNTITNPSAVLDFTVFLPGYTMTINGSPSNQYPYATPVTILTVQGNVITVDTRKRTTVRSRNRTVERSVDNVRTLRL